MIHPSPLAAKISAVNNANRYALEIYPVLRGIFEPLVGEKILKSDGSLLAKYENLLPEFPYKNSLRVYYSRSNYSLVWVVKTCESFQGDHDICWISQYHETSVYVGELNGNILVSLCKEPELRTDYTVQEIEEARETYKQAKRVADSARSALGSFGEYD